MEVEYIVDYVDFKTFEKALYIAYVYIKQKVIVLLLEMELLSKKCVEPRSWCVINTPIIVVRVS